MFLRRHVHTLTGLRNAIVQPRVFVRHGIWAAHTPTPGLQPRARVKPPSAQSRAPTPKPPPAPPLKSRRQQPSVTVIVTYYNAPDKLRCQVQHWERELAQVLSENFAELIVVDDGSVDQPLTTDRVATLVADAPTVAAHLRVFRVPVDVGFNNEGARNVGAAAARGATLVLLDMDNVVSAAALRSVGTVPGNTFMYFPRHRMWWADCRFEKGVAPASASSAAPLKRSPNSFAVSKALFWHVGAYNEDLSGWYGSDTEFRQRIHERGCRVLTARVPIGIVFEFGSRTKGPKTPRPKCAKVPGNHLRLGFQVTWPCPQPPKDAI